MNTTYLLMGGNLGDVRQTFAAATLQIEKKIGVIQRRSSLYKTAAWGMENQPDFLNQVLEVQTNLAAPTLLESVLKIEQQSGRIRQQKYGPRKIDIDILLFNEEIVDQKDLKIPHPLLHKRNFVLYPLADLAPHAFHPVLKKDIQTLLAQSEDKLKVEKLDI